MKDAVKKVLDNNVKVFDVCGESKFVDKSDNIDINSGSGRVINTNNFWN